MAEEKKTADTAAKASPKKAEDKGENKFVAWCKALPKRIATPFKNMWYELKKVTWPSKRKLMTYSIVVLIFIVFLSVVIGLLDMGASALVRLLV